MVLYSTQYCHQTLLALCCCGRSLSSEQVLHSRRRSVSTQEAPSSIRHELALRVPKEAFEHVEEQFTGMIIKQRSCVCHYKQQSENIRIGSRGRPCTLCALRNPCVLPCVRVFYSELLHAISSSIIYCALRNICVVLCARVCFLSRDSAMPYRPSSFMCFL